MTLHRRLSAAVYLCLCQLFVVVAQLNPPTTEVVTTTVVTTTVTTTTQSTTVFVLSPTAALNVTPSPTPQTENPSSRRGISQLYVAVNCEELVL